MGAQLTALAVADKIIRLSLADENPLTPMQVQKLTYFCHAWMLGLGHGPLFQDAVEAWQYGPVIRAVYHALKHHQADPIREPLLEPPATFSEREENLIRTVWRLYGNLDGLQLSMMTHVAGSPWDQTHQRDPRSQIIYNHIIRDYYADLIAERTAKEGEA